MTRTWPLALAHGGPRRGSTFLLRQQAGIHRRRRVQLHVRRDDALQQLAGVDAQLDRLSAERVALLEELEAVRDTLWPVMPHWKGRRPPALDRPPLPPATPGATASRAGDLRVLCLVLLGRNGPLALPDLHALVHRYGWVISGHHPVKALADAMGYEVRKGRAVRVARGVYDLHPDLRLHGLPRWPDPPGLGEPLEWDGPRQRTPDGEVGDEGGDGLGHGLGHDAGDGPHADWSDTPADGPERTDPGRWGGDTWPDSPPAQAAQADDHPSAAPPPILPPRLPRPHGNESAQIRSRGTAERTPADTGESGGGNGRGDGGDGAVGEGDPHAPP